MEHEATSNPGKIPAVTGALLAGGRSSRMGGREKGMLAVAGKPMLAHVIARLAPQVGRIVINANGDPARFAGFRLPVVADVLEGYAGPLAGLHACLAWARAETPEARYVATVPIDTPFLPTDMVARLLAALQEAGARAAVLRLQHREGSAIPSRACGMSPSSATWPRRCSGASGRCIASPRRRARPWSTSPSFTWPARRSIHFAR
jgi:molybdopterin-guanine dinucleotide biosynthesis protein A